jgi:hypothetical protein
MGIEFHMEHKRKISAVEDLLRQLDRAKPPTNKAVVLSNERFWEF